MDTSQIKPITYLKNRTADLVREVAESGKTVVITQNGEAKVAVMGVETYDNWRKAMALLRLAAHAQVDLDAGRTVTQEEAFKAADRAIARAKLDA
jgi:prevent-host-death family protein